MDFWPISLSRLSRSIERIRLLEVVDMKAYDSVMGRMFMGFGLPPDQHTPLDEMHLDWQSSPFYASMSEIADAMGLTFDTVRYDREEGITERAVEVAVGTLEAGHRRRPPDHLHRCRRRPRLLRAPVGLAHV